MSKKRKFSLVSPSTFPLAPNQREKNEPIDWLKCIICQTDKSERLIDPTVSNRSDPSKCFERLSNDLNQFNELGYLPFSLSHFIIEGKTLHESFLLKETKFHKTCRNRYDQYHLKRIQNSTVESPCKKTDYTKQTRSSFSSPNFQSSCIFCDKSDGYLRQARSYDIDARVRKGATLLCDEKLLAKLSEGDMPAIEAKYHASCLCRFYNKTEHLHNEGETSQNKTVAYGVCNV